MVQNTASDTVNPNLEDICATLKKLVDNQVTLQHFELEIGQLKSTIQGFKDDLVAKEVQIKKLESTVAAQGLEISRLKGLVECPKSPEVPPKEILDLVLAGDSIINHVEVDPLNPGGNNLKVCVRGGLISDLRKEILYLLSKYIISEIILQVGSNNSETEGAHYIVYQLNTLADEIKSKSPGTNIYIGDVLPRWINRNSQTNFDIFGHIHRRLRGASKKGHFKLINNYQFWRKNEGKYVQNYKLFSRKDHVHPNYKGVELLTENYTNRFVWQNRTSVDGDSAGSPPNNPLASNGHQIPQIVINRYIATATTTSGHQNVSENGVYVRPVLVEPASDPL